MSTATEVKPYDLNESEDISQELCAKVTEPTILDFDDDLHAEYESFSFYPVQANLLFEYCKSEIVESNNVVTKNFDLN